MLSSLHVALSRIRAFFRRRELDRDFELELEAHLAMAEEEKIRQGLSRREARRLARVELGGLAQLAEAGREARGLPWLDSLWIDLKLGLRRLRKSWGLTLVGGFAMTVAIAIGTAVIAFFDILWLGELPLDEGDRVVALQTWDVEEQRRLGTLQADFDRWRESVGSIEDVGAFQTVERNLEITGGSRAPVEVAEMTASGFALARVSATLGRTLLPSDESADADPVAVIGYDLWQARFAADPAILGRTVRLGETIHTIVGVMPEGFRFPINHQLWVPLGLEGAEAALKPEPGGGVFARLVPGVTPEKAEAELATVGLLPRSDFSDGELRARLLPFSFSYMSEAGPDEIRWMMLLAVFGVVLLLIPPCANIAILVYARTVTRQEEFAARFVLGARRSRIVLQILIELLVLSLAAAVLALFLVHQAAALFASRNPEAPFWIDFGLSLRSVAFAAGLAVIAAVIAGLVPALKTTARGMLSGLQALSSRTGMRLGATWTALVVAQIALSLAVLPATAELAWGTIRKGALGPGFAADRFLTARIELDPELDGSAMRSEPAALADRFETVQDELIRRLSEEPGVAGVSRALAVPGKGPWETVEIEGIARDESGALGPDRLVRSNRVDDAFFALHDISVLAGRPFDSRDYDPAGDGSRSSARVAIVNRTFSKHFFGQENPLGQRVRYPYADRAASQESGAPVEPIWYRIVGIVTDCPDNVSRGTIYHPAPPGELHPASLSIRVDSPPGEIADRLREIAAGLDPALRVEEVFTLAEIYREQAVGNHFGAMMIALVTVSVLLLSAAGIYALMSFTVNQRRREIGIRCALGAPPRRLLAGVFRRALRQLGLGATIGMLLAALIDSMLPIERVGGWEVPGVIPAATVLMVVVGLLAASGPARRGLRVEATEALRDG